MCSCVQTQAGSEAQLIDSLVTNPAQFVEEKGVSNPIQPQRCKHKFLEQSSSLMTFHSIIQYIHNAPVPYRD